MGVDASDALDALLGAIYHRYGLLRADFTQAGIGAVTQSGARIALTDLSITLAASLEATAAAPGTAALTLWPVDGAQLVPGGFDSDSEAPDPMPDLARVGYPVSVQAQRPGARMAVQRFVIERADTGAAVPARLLTAAADPGRTPEGAAAIVPLARLAQGSAFVASFEGNVDGVPVSRRWSFTTAPVTITASAATARAGERVEFVVRGLNASEAFRWCMSNAALLSGEARFSGPHRFTLTVRDSATCASGTPACSVRVSASLGGDCTTPAAAATISVVR